VRTLQAEFPDAELVFDSYTPFVVWADNLQLAFSKVEKRLYFALKHSRDVETWNPVIAKSTGIFLAAFGRSCGGFSD